jgi:hypothetical protein
MAMRTLIRKARWLLIAAIAAIASALKAKA